MTIATPSLMSPYISAADLATVTGSEASIGAADLSVLLASIPTVDSAPLAARVAFPTASEVYVSDLYETAAYAVSGLWALPRTGGAPYEISSGRAALQSDGSIAATGQSANITTEAVKLQPQSVANCTGCVLGGIAAGAAIGAADCSPADFIPVAGWIIDGGCGIAGGIGGAAVGKACEASACSGSDSTPGTISMLAENCSFNSCDIRVQVNNHNRQLISLGSTVYWFYAPGAYATLDSGGSASEEGNGTYWSLGPIADAGGGGQIYDHTHYADEPVWTECTYEQQTSVTAQWSDYSFKSTKTGGGKPAMAQCPGMFP